MRTLARLQTGRVSSWLVLVGAFLIIGAAFALLPKTSSDSAPSTAAPDSYQSTQVSQLLKGFPDADKSAALVIYQNASSSDDAPTPDGTALTAADKTAVATAATALADESSTPQAVRPQFSDDGTTALVVVPVEAQADTEKIVDQADDIRAAAKADGLTAYVSGPVGFQADTVNAFAGADIRLLVITAAVVALLLIITYRSPVLWLVPLVVVAMADGLSRFLVSAVAARFDIAADASILGILSVLVFGAGTDYALLLIARYREELLVEERPRDAMSIAVRQAGPAILASGGTVILSLLVLLLASLDSNRALGIACAIGIALALLFALLVLPAAIVVCGRGLFWPLIPRFAGRDGAGSAADAGRSAHQQAGHTHHHHAAPKKTVWARIGHGVERRPKTVIAGALVLAALLSGGIGGLKVGLDQSDLLVGNPESVQGETILSAEFGATSTATILTPTASVDEATSIAKATKGVESVSTGDRASGYTELTATLGGAPQSDANNPTITALRDAYASKLDGDGGAGTSGSDSGSGDAGAGTSSSASTLPTLVGGSDAAALDEATAAEHDRDLVIPLILAVVFVILVLLLRSLVAPLLLIASVVITFFASLGAGNLLFTHVFGFPALDTSVVLFSFLFLVALGVDYNIFLATRAREERDALGARPGMLEALTRTGGVITSAGIVLAAVFVVLGVLPVVALAQIGTIVCIGVLLDTLVIRTLLVPALGFVLGEAFWWPARRRVSADDEQAAHETAPAGSR